jgi:hypothetical protein
LRDRRSWLITRRLLGCGLGGARSPSPIRERFTDIRNAGFWRRCGGVR